MALITDPDNLSQGTETVVSDLAFTSSGVGATNRTVLTSTANLPAIDAGDFFEIRDSSTAGNNGLYVEVGGSPTTSSITCEKVVGANPADLAAESTSTFGHNGTAGDYKSVHFDTNTKTIYLFEQGNLSVDGVTMLAFHSFAKEEWKQDPFLIAAAAFPMVGISFAAGQWVFGQDPSGNNNGWKPAENDATYTINTRQLFRNAGWDEINASGFTIKKLFNATTLGDFDNAVDQAYYRYGTDATDTGAGVNFVYADKVNEPVLYFEEVGNPDTFTFVDGAGGDDTATRTSGSFITDGFQVGGQMTVRAATTSANDGTYTITGVAALTLTFATGTFNTGEADTTAQIAVDNSNAITLFLREQGKTFDQANLTSAGETAISSKIIKFPLSNGTDLDITKADPVTGDPWDEVRIRYLAETYNRAVESATLRDFGIVVDVGTYSQANGVSNGTATVTSAGLSLGSGEALADYAGGTLTLHDATGGDRAIHTISGTPTDAAGTLTIVLTAALTNSETSLSFTMDRATPKTATLAEIHEKLQYQLRQASDIDETGSVVVGNTADRLSNFVGPVFKSGAFIPVNPNSLTDTGVIVEGFSASDRPNYRAVDNTGTERQFPFVSAGNLNFSSSLVDDAAGEYWLYYDYIRENAPVNTDTVGTADAYVLTADSGIGTGHAIGDYLLIAGFANPLNNGLFVVTAVTASDTDITVRRVDGQNVDTDETNVSGVTVREHPYPSPQATIVDDNSGTDIVGAITVSPIGFDFDWNGNVQEGRTGSTTADVVLIAGGFENAQMAIVSGLQITESTTLSFSVTAAQERNAVNP